MDVQNVLVFSQCDTAKPGARVVWLCSAQPRSQVSLVAPKWPGQWQRREQGVTVFDCVSHRRHQEVLTEPQAVMEWRGWEQRSDDRLWDLARITKLEGARKTLNINLLVSCQMLS